MRRDTGNTPGPASDLQPGDNLCCICRTDEEHRDGIAEFISDRLFDNGIAIAPGNRERILDLSETPDPDRVGGGVGFAPAKRIVEVHNGMRWGESDGHGKREHLVVHARDPGTVRA